MNTRRSSRSTGASATTYSRRFWSRRGRSASEAEPPAEPRRGATTLAAFGTTLFTSAVLAFGVQPMFAKMVLPLLGGSPSVWLTSMLFFQSMLLLGYAYAHATTTWLGARRQAFVHLLVLLVPLAVLPIAIPRGWVPDPGQPPVLWLLGLLALGVGIPYFAVTTTAPLLQRWFSRTVAPGARDPYVLYGASNLGSMAALLSYPTLVEPSLRLADQGRVWAVTYGVLVALVAVCAVALWRSPHAAAPEPPPPPRERLTAARRARWVGLAIVPSSLTLGTTTFLTTDIAPIPLLWVVPLSIYLLTFVIVFARRPLPQAWTSRALPWLVVPLVLAMAFRADRPLWVLGLLHLLTLFVAAMVCHGRLAADRPPPVHLTEFYVWLALGGALGGVLNAVVAPLVLDTLAEYPVMLVLACLARPGRGGTRRSDRVLDVAVPAAIGLFVLVARAATDDAVDDETVRRLIVFAVPAAVCFVLAARPVRFGLGVAALLLAAAAPVGVEPVLFADRNFFGVLHVVSESGTNVLYHGTTIHGLADPARPSEPLGYHTRGGPIGQILEGRGERLDVGVVGLGTGAMACLGPADGDWTFYEIDPAVVRIARDPALFSYLSACRPNAEMVLGDGRLSLAGERDRRYDVLALDAFNSDSVPVHLLTREAVVLYVERLAPGGVLAFNVSNRYLDLRPVLGDIASDLGLVGIVRQDRGAERRMRGAASSDWVAIARRDADLGALLVDPSWVRLPRGGGDPWTDDFSNVLGAFRWR